MPPHTSAPGRPGDRQGLVITRPLPSLTRQAPSTRAERGELLLAGALADPADAAMLLFKGESPDAAERFARADPYVLNGLVRKWRVRPWTTVVGEMAATPVRPGA
jgi:hypothetical protein